MIKLTTERAHLMCPNMFFGIQFKINQEFISDKFDVALTRLTNMHPTTLMNVFWDNENNTFLENKNNNALTYTQIDSLNYKEIFHSTSKSTWDTTKEPLLRIYVSASASDFSVLFVAHHILCDGRGLFTLASDFADIYVKDKKSKPIIPVLIQSQSDLPVKSDLPFISKVITRDANKRFAKENHTVSYSDYLQFENTFGNNNPISYDTELYKKDETKKLIALCKDNNVSVNDYLVAKMMQQENKSTLLIASDIRKKLSNYVPGSVGNFASAYSIKVKKLDNDTIKLAKKIKAINAKIANTPSKEMLVLSFYLMLDKNLLDAIAISALGDFKSESGNFVGCKMFGYEARSNISITNLGKFKSDTMSEAFFIPPASPANEKTWGVLTLNDKMTIIKAEAQH